MWRVAQPRLARRSLEHDGANIGVRKPFDPRVFLAEADATGQQDDRRCQRQATEVYVQRIYL